MAGINSIFSKSFLSRARRMAFAVSALLLALPLAGCIETNSFKYRITIDVQTSEGLKQGSSVIYVVQRRVPDFLRGLIAEGAEHTGEATFVDLGRNRLLVGLLWIPAESMAHMPITAFNVDYRPGESRVLPPALWPVMIVFADPKDPKSGRLVDNKDPRSATGDAVIKQVKIEIVGAGTPIPSVISQFLPWWGSAPEIAEQALRSAGMKGLPTSGYNHFSVRME